ncbi:hypothetical protein CXP39_01745 [Mesoplasma syrphidae]|uniref:Uncharacterized protein n=1 Tax=Mesoplasma syrphidae TaxID=225999 RepID=A0A2K9BN97_9MOLU|nr:hypothetical protein [Mesoplasma syrphidae]AUF83513.1 hypothetical protein CXP39_01745 [Mesoplasma syrphidae]
MKKIGKRISIVLAAIGMGTTAIISVGLVTPGMGLESYKFINSVKKQINTNFAKNKFVIDGSSLVYEMIVNSAIKSSYKADALSSTNWYSAKESNSKRIDEYNKFIDNWFDARWGETIKNKQDIDLNDVSMDLIKFDKAFATEFHSYGYVNPGFTWIFKKGVAKDMLSFNLKNTEMYQEALEKQTTIEQNFYDSKVKHTGPGLNGIDVTSSLGSYIVNNKVWFINIQRANVDYALNDPIAKAAGVFKDKTLTSADLPSLITADDLYQPNFTSGIIVTAIGTWMLLVITPIVLTSGTIVIVTVNVKSKKGGQ